MDSSKKSQKTANKQHASEHRDEISDNTTQPRKKTPQNVIINKFSKMLSRTGK